MKTRAAVLVQLNKPLEILDLEIPPLRKGQVLVKMAYSGLCGTQLNEWKGTKGPDPYLPHTLGHEGAGIVLEVGEGVEKVKKDDHVVLSWIKGTGLDVPSTIYRHQGNVVNSGAISTFIDIAIISENRLIPIPTDTPMRDAALLGCAIPTGAGVIFNDMKVKEGESVAVFGVGGIGSSAILAANFVKAKPIVAIDVSNEKLERAKRLGATHTIFAGQENVHDKLNEITVGKGIDFALESAGRKEVMEMAFSAVRPTGGHCVLAGNLPKGDKIHLNPFDLIQGKRITGTWGGSANIDQDVDRYINIFVKKDNILNQMVSHEVKLEEINSLMAALNEGRIARGMISFI